MNKPHETITAETFVERTTAMIGERQARRQAGQQVTELDLFGGDIAYVARQVARDTRDPRKYRSVFREVNEARRRFGLEPLAEGEPLR